MVLSDYTNFFLSYYFVHWCVGRCHRRQRTAGHVQQVQNLVSHCPVLTLILFSSDFVCICVFLGFYFILNR